VTLWDFAVAIHGEPGVDAGLIDLQDNHGQCVSYLLWAVWAARLGRPVGAAQLEAAAALARAWEAEVGGPLRAARRNLKRPWPPMDDDSRGALRSDVKAVEMQAERALIEALEAATPEGSGDADVAGRLSAAMAAWSPPAPISAAGSLLPIFERFAI
jgi:uncharacterized protein (TIGR02444 family)